MIRLLIADDHAIVRSGLRQLFALTQDIAVGGEAVDGLQTLETLRSGDFDLVLLDLTMPGIGGVTLVSRVRGEHPELPILVLSMHNELQVAKRALQAGANGFVTKGSGPDTLVAAIRKVAEGGRFIDPVLVEQMMFETHAEGGDLPHERLSERELQILKALARGRSVNEIAEDLFISNKTVSTHKARLMQKMNFGTNAELVRYAADHGLVE